MKITRKFPNGQMISADQIIDGLSNGEARNQLSIKELTETIRRCGVIQPPVVKRTVDGKFKVIIGHRHIAALRILKWRIIPVFVLDDDHPLARTDSRDSECEPEE